LIQNAKIGKYDLVLNYDLLKTKVQDESINKDYYFKSAINQTELLLESYPNHPILLSQLGVSQMYDGDLKKAILTYENLRTIAPNRHSNLMDLGMLYLQNSEFDKAIAMFDYVYAMDKNYQTALINKAYGYLQMKDSTNSRIIIEQISIKTIVDNFDKVYDIYEKMNDSEALLLKIENATSDEKLGVFQPQTFKSWLDLAVKLKNNSSIKRSIFECLSSYKIEYNQQEIDRLVLGIQQNDFSANLFFEKFDGKIVK
jgi:tetratricopeptide (TPR) repeat protein